MQFIQQVNQVKLVLVVMSLNHYNYNNDVSMHNNILVKHAVNVNCTGAAI